MAVSGFTTWEVQTGGSDTNGGGFVEGASGTDYSQQTSAQLTVTDGACSATTTLTSATGGFTSAMVGNIVYLSSGPGWYEITAYTDTNTVTIDRAGPSASGMTLNVGGCLGSPGGLSQAINNCGGSVNGMNAWIKSGTYTLTTTAAFTSGGPLHIPSTTGLEVEGYGSTRGDNGTKPVLDAAALTSFSMVLSPTSTTGSSANYNASVRNIKVDGNGNAGVYGFEGKLFYHCKIYNCEATDCSWGFYKVFAVGSKAYSCTNGFGSGFHYACVADACGDGFSSGYSSGCLAINCTDDGFTATRTGIYACTAYNCGGDGFDLNIGNRTAGAVSCLAVNNTGYGFRLANNTAILDCAVYNNTAGNVLDTNYNTQVNVTTLTANPFVSTTNLALNDTAGGGAVAVNSGTTIPDQTVAVPAGAMPSGVSASGGGIQIARGMHGGMRG